MSNRKKARGRGGNAVGSDAATQQAMLQVLAGLQAWQDEIQTGRDLRAAARRVWCGGEDPVPAAAPSWPEDSLGGRFFAGMQLETALQAPCLATAPMPDLRVIAAEPAHWNVATSVLLRAVLLDGMPVDDPAVTQLLGVLAPVAEAELSYGQAAILAAYGTGSGWMADEPEFPEMDGPVFLLGAGALIDAIDAVIGEDSLDDVLGVLIPLLDDALPGLEGLLVAEALLRSYSRHYRCEMPGDEQVLERWGTPGSGNPLEDLVTARAVAPADVLRVGLRALAALGELCKSESASVLGVAA